MNLWQEYWNPVRVFLGLGAEPQTLTFVQISLRGIIVFMFTLLMVRISARRSLARRTVFDSVFLVILASVLARAINGSADLLPTVGGGFAMVAFHRLLAWIAFYSHGAQRRFSSTTGNWCSGGCGVTTLRDTISRKICDSICTLTISSASKAHASNAAVESASSANNHGAGIRYWTLSACQTVALRRRVQRSTLIDAAARQTLHSRSCRGFLENVGGILAADDQPSRRRF